ncbi:MAG: pyrroloquinoline quinone-dependent dehydrogenase [Gemmatimonadota bacterium]|nr:pyrroloquinoline quinone-dependent dehydrogenase [Gemmatimonadota bacterium]
MSQPGKAMRHHICLSKSYASCVAAAIVLTAPALFAQRAASGWPAYGGDPGGTRYSAADEINASNVRGLELAWIARTGDFLMDRGRFEATPILVNGTLYIGTPLGSVVALDPTTGAEKWKFNGPVQYNEDYGDFANRGVAAWSDPGAAGSVTGRGRAKCAERIFVATVNARLIALDGATGDLCEGFGAKGSVDLTVGLRHKPQYHWEYGVTSPPTVVRDLVIVGSAVPDNHRTDSPDGVIRAFDARNGVLRWSFDPIPRDPGQPGYDTWRGPKAHDTGAANAWSVFSADTTRDLVFIPVGSASPDFFGGERLGDNRYANSVVALRASTGAFVWAFQVVHHDLWDYDVPAQPVLFTLRRAGKAIPAVAIGTKMGHVFILDRRDGKPLFPVEERAVPASDVPGEVASPTQPFPPAAFRLSPESLSTADAFGVTDSARTACRAKIAALRNEGVFTPPSQKGTVIWPGNIGGINWSGVSVDERRGILVAPTNQLAFVVRLIPRDSLRSAAASAPDLEYGRQSGTPYAMSRTTLETCTRPPWGTMTALDLNTGTVKWRVPLGWFPQYAKVPESRNWGSVNLGGAMLTASGLVFSAGTFDQHLRAMDIETGKELWSAPLPAAAHALPMTYTIGGTQYVVVAAGGHDRLHTAMGDYVVAYALPRAGAPAVDTARGSLAGDWAGEMHIGDARVRMKLSLQTAGGITSARAGLDSVQITAPVTVRRDSRGVTISFPLRYPAKHDCTATLSATLDLWNGGKLLEGSGTLDGECADRGHQEAAFVFRRSDKTDEP